MWKDSFVYNERDGILLTINEPRGSVEIAQ